MKPKILITFFTASIVCFLGIKTISAQNPGREEFNKVYEDYRLKNEDYNKAHDDYILAKTQYEKFKTLTSKTNAQVATAKMLVARDDVVIYYLSALKVRINDTSVKISDDKKNSLYQSIDAEVAWFTDHKNRISQADLLTDLVNKSDEAKSRFTNLNYLLYDSLFSISNGRVVSYRERFQAFFNDLTDLVNKIKGEKRVEYKFSDEKLAVIDRWIIETQDRLAKGDTENSKSVQIASQMNSKSNNTNVYRQTIDSLTKANNFLKDAVSYSKEIVREIKVAEE
jgi:hypothetical protein